MREQTVLVTSLHTLHKTPAGPFIPQMLDKCTTISNQYVGKETTLHTNTIAAKITAVAISLMNSVKISSLPEIYKSEQVVGYS